MSTPATAALRRAGAAFTEHSFTTAGRGDYGLEAAAALGIDPDRVFKTLIADLDDELVVGIVPVSCRLDLKALARALGGKRCALADPALAERRTGYVVGGISPLGQKSALRTALDETAELWDSILVSGGRRGLDLELRPADLVRLTDATVADLAR